VAPVDEHDGDPLEVDTAAAAALVFHDVLLVAFAGPHYLSIVVSKILDIMVDVKYL